MLAAFYMANTCHELHATETFQQEVAAKTQKLKCKCLGLLKEASDADIIYWHNVLDL